VGDGVGTERGFVGNNNIAYRDGSGGGARGPSFPF